MIQRGIEQVFTRPVIPVLTIERLPDAVPLARALVAGGLDVLEITLRTPVALAALGAIRAALPAAVLGAGTVTRPGQLRELEAIGVDFAVSPGTTPRLLEAARASLIAWLPGAATLSESLLLLEQGAHYQKLFPATSVGGIEYLQAFFGPLPEVRFCPTGGINGANAAAFLACPNVASVGGSWVAGKDWVAAGAWAEITEAAAAAAALPWSGSR